MIDGDVLLEAIKDLAAEDLDRWILYSWVRPARDGKRLMFRQIDVARVRLILELRNNMHIDEEALPVVLSLLDQLYDTRRRMRDVADALELIAPEELRRRILDHLTVLSVD